MGIIFGKLFKSAEEDVVSEDVVSVAVKRKRTEDDETQEKKRRRLDSIPCDNELPCTSGDTESRNTLEAQISGNRKAVADDGAVEKEKRKLFEAKYEEQEKLGQGGCVFAGYRKADNLAVAIKHIPTDGEILIHTDNNGEMFPMEVAVMMKLGAESKRHPAPVDLLEWYDLGEELVVVMERPSPAVDLLQYIRAKGGSLQEKEAKIIMRQLVDAALNLQQKHIFHRDIKVDNLLIETALDAPRLRVIDFGLSCFAEEGDQYDDFYGYHAPPEWDSRLEYKAGPTTVYQIGVVLFDMLQNPTLRLGIVYQREIIKWWFSENCRDFFKGCFRMDPEERLTLEQLRNHLWLR